MSLKFENDMKRFYELVAERQHVLGRYFSMLSPNITMSALKRLSMLF